MSDIMELNHHEIEEVSGGIVPLLAIAVTLILAAAGGGYMVGKDMAERDNRAD